MRMFKVEDSHTVSHIVSHVALTQPFDGVGVVNFFETFQLCYTSGYTPINDVLAGDCLKQLCTPLQHVSFFSGCAGCFAVAFQICLQGKNNTSTVQCKLGLQLTISLHDRLTFT